MRLNLALGVLLLTVPLAGCMTDPISEPGQPPAWSFTDTEGEVHSTETASGSPTVLFFFATWCSSCKRMTGDLAQVHQAYGPNSEGNSSVDILSISFDPLETEEDFERWKAQYEQPWPHGKDPGRDIQRTFGIQSQSSVVVLDSEGFIVERWGYGQADASSISSAIDRALS